LPHEIRAVIARIATECPTWSPRRIRDEARLKLGVKVAEATVRKYLGLDRGRPRDPSQRWMTFLRNHADQLVAMDLFTVCTAGFRTLYVLVVMHVGTRRILHLNVTTGAHSAWVQQQLREAVPIDHGWRFLLHDRDAVFSRDVDAMAGHLGLRSLRTPPHSPQANSFCELVIGTLRRECLDHLIVLGERHLRRILGQYVEHYNRGRPHMSLGPGIPDPPEGLPVAPSPNRHALPEGYAVVSHPVLNGLHCDYRLHKCYAPRRIGRLRAECPENG
jgi:transposase InsO family protein